MTSPGRPGHSRSRRRFALVLLLVALAAVTTCDRCRPEPPEEVLRDVEFHQLDWYRPDGTLAQASSLWGRMAFTYDPGDEDRYVNLALETADGSGSAWVVWNLPLFAVDNGDYAERREAVDIDLSDLGLRAGETWRATRLGLAVDDAVRQEAPAALDRSSAVEVLERRATDSIDESPDPGPFTDPGRPDGIKIKQKPVKGSKTRDVRAVQEGRGKCFAGACARSLDWLNREHGLGSDKTAQEIYDDLIDADVSKPNDDGSTARDEWIARKNDYALAMSGERIVTKVWDPGGMVDPVPGVEESSDDFASWLQAELDAGEDVELAYFGPGIAHIVTVLEFYTEDGKTYVKYRDDETQGDDTKGDGAVKNKRIYKGADGRYRFGSDANVIYFAVSQSVTGGG